MLRIVSENEIVLAYLNNLMSATVKETLNGEYLLSFIAIIEELKTEYLYDNDNLVKYNNDLFRVVQLDELHSEEGMLTVSATCEHISYDLIKKKMPNFNYKNQSASYVMIKALEGTGFSFTGTDITQNTTIQYTEECNSKQITIAIANNWRGELEYFRKDIKLWKQRGQNRGVDFRFRKNLNSVKRILNYAEETVSYEVDVVGDNTTLELGYFELGDTVRIIDDRLNIDEEKRIIEVEKDILTGFNSKVVLGDKIKDLRSSFTNVESKVKEVEINTNELAETIGNNAEEWNKIKTITDNQGNVVASKINGLLNTANAMIQNSTGTMRWTGNTLVCHNQPTEEASNFIVEIGSTGIRFANNKNQDGSWNWRTALSAEGVVADKVFASAIAGLTIDSVKLTSTEIVSGLISGVTIQGVTILGSNIIGGNPSGVHTAINQTEPFRIKNGNTVMAELWADSSGNAFLSFFPLDANKGFTLRYGDKATFNSIGGMRFETFQKVENYAKEYEFELSDSGHSIMKMFPNGNMWMGRNQRYTDIFGDTKIYSNLEVTGDLIVGGEIDGDKNAIVSTENYGIRKMYCEESDRVYFNTKGVEVTTEKNKCIIKLNEMFLQTIELNSIYPYIISLTAYSNAKVWVKEIYDKYIIVESDKPTKFSYNIQCTRKNRKDTYMEEFDKEARRTRKREVN
jgi:hypothetical protein